MCTFDRKKKQVDTFILTNATHIFYTFIYIKTYHMLLYYLGNLKNDMEINMKCRKMY